MIGRASCADLAELRSAFLDGALRDADRDRVLAHLVDCDSCRRDVEDLRRVRSILAGRGAAPAPASLRSLSTRLMAIPDAAPRGLRHRHPRVGRRFGRLVTGVLAVGLGAALAGGIGYAAAPVPVAGQVDDPTPDAVREYSGVLAELPFTPDAASATAAVRPTARRAVPAPRSVAAPNGRPLPAEQLRRFLQRAVRAGDQTSFEGTQSYLAVAGEQQVSARVRVVHAAGRGAELTTVDAGGAELDSSFQAAEAAGRVAERDDVLALLQRAYDVSGRTGVEVAGRPAVLVEARRPPGLQTSLAPSATPVARWWLDAATGLVLWQETYDAGGAVQVSTGFTEVRVGPVQLTHWRPTVAARTTASLTVSAAADLAGAGWACRDDLAGLTLVRLRSDAAADPGMVHMVYSDGLATVSVLEQRGRLVDTPQGSRRDPAIGADVTSGSPTAATWQSGDTVFTVVTDPGGPLAQVVAALPHDTLPQPSTMDRVRAGWTRILGSR